MIRFKHSGSFKNTEDFFKRAKARSYRTILKKYAELGAKALADNTPKNTGLTASAWSYEIFQEDGRDIIYWNNTNIHHGVNIALILQYGHGTGTGGYVHGIDYINPAIRPIMDQLAEEAWKEVVER